MRVLASGIIKIDCAVSAEHNTPTPFADYG